MSLKNRRGQERLERQNSILDAAEQMFFDKGYERTSMDEIARTAQLSRALLYVYFKDKAAILRGITLRAGEELRRRFEAAIDPRQPGLEQIAAIGVAYCEFSRQKPDYFDVLTHAASLSLGEDDESLEALETCEVRTMDVLVSALTAGLADGSLSRQRIRQPLETALYLRGALHGVIMLSKQEAGNYGTGRRRDPDSLVQHAMEMLAESLRT